jgi:hypothetical protein
MPRRRPHDHRGAGIGRRTGKGLTFGQHQMHPRALDPVERLDRAREFPLHRAHAVDVLHETVHAQTRGFVEDLPARLAVRGQALLGQRHARAGHIGARHTHAGAVGADLIGDPRLVERIDHRGRRAGRQLAVERRVIRRRQQRQAEQKRHHPSQPGARQNHQPPRAERAKIVDDLLHGAAIHWVFYMNSS